MVLEPFSHHGGKLRHFFARQMNSLDCVSEMPNLVVVGNQAVLVAGHVVVGVVHIFVAVFSRVERAVVGVFFGIHGHVPRRVELQVALAHDVDDVVQDDLHGAVEGVAELLRKRLAQKIGVFVVCM